MGQFLPAVGAFVVEPIRQTPVLGEFDVVVLGGGPSGIVAAAAAARAGQRTLLVERYGFLGGMGTAAGVTNFCGLHANLQGHLRQVVHGLADDLLARMRALGGLNEPHALFGGRIVAQAYDNAAYKIAADELVLGSGAQLLFHATAAGVLMDESARRDEPGRIEALLLETRSGRRAVRARSFIDCSGDGDLAAWAGAPFEKGRPVEGGCVDQAARRCWHASSLTVRVMATWPRRPARRLKKARTATA